MRSVKGERLDSPWSPTSTVGVSLRLAGLAVDALLDEIDLFPKPGLVSPVDTGSHHDMDYVLMRVSAESLREPFSRIAGAAAAGAAFESGLVPLGVEAERRMLEATGGINTHRGAIFAMGLLVAATARAGIDAGPDSVRSGLLEEWGPALLRHAKSDARVGARLEAAAGYPSLFERALPHYRSRLNDGFAADAAAIETLFLLIASVSDTNLTHRGGLAGAAFARGRAEAFLGSGGISRADWKARAIGIHAEFVQKNLSPGGAADLLAGTLFLHLPSAAEGFPVVKDARKLLMNSRRLSPGAV